ncbi:MAG: 3-isopropylmalate dehydratase large subunit [Candidatus Lambdaproteobacteria bacterium]|nr:3-isopropylmalate dehydratase large subunit [Candidatus Lambdaproteobacteria bacterium]
MPQPRSLFEKIWDAHAILVSGESETLLYVTRALVQDSSRHAFEDLREAGRKVHRPAQIFASPDHYTPTLNRAQGFADPEYRFMVEGLAKNARDFGFTHFAMDDERQGILHVIAPEQGITLPGIVLCAPDSHTATNGAVGCLAFGIGTSETTHVLASQTLWLRKPKSMRVRVEGPRGFGITAKDVILAIIARTTVAGGVGHVVEYAGSTLRAMSMEERMTVCNMSIEFGARAGTVAPDETTFRYLHGRPFAPKGEAWERALDDWRRLPSDPDARFDREVELDAREIVPMVTWGTTPDTGLPITGRVPDPAREPDPVKRAGMERALKYMALTPGTPLAGLAIDRVFIGSCTNARIEDLRAAAEVARRGKVKVPAWVVPGSGLVKRQAEAEGLDRVFRAAGFEWREPGCSMCTGNIDKIEAGERCASTINRNFEGRMGWGSRAHLVSPTMAAAAALAGVLIDVRTLGDSR